MTADPAIARHSPPALSARIPYAFAKMHGVLAFAEEGDAIVVLLRPDATVEGIAELKRVLQRPLATRSVDPERFAAELARTYNTAASGAAGISDDLARETDLARLMQDLPPAEDLLDSGTQAPVIRMINALLAAGAARTCLRPSLRAVREALGRAFSRRRHAARRDRAAARAARALWCRALKIMASLDIAEKRLPQDGRIACSSAASRSTCASRRCRPGRGERVVLRLLDKDSAQLDLADLGMSAADARRDRPR